jgi:putative membrane protein
MAQMSNTEVAVVKQRSLAKGLIAGLIGGLVGAVAMAVAERMFPRRAQEQPGQHDPTPKTPASEGIHWGFGAAVGAAYGAVAEFYPAATSREGVNFGMALEALTQEGALPASVGPDDPEDQTTRERASELTSRVVFGITTETVRGFVRKRL